MFKKVMRWYKRTLIRQYQLMGDIQHWRMSSLVKALAGSTVCLLTVTYLTVQWMFLIATDRNMTFLISGIFIGSVGTLGVLVMLPLGVRANNFFLCILMQRNGKKE